ncbi:hypothetical protein [uncultured Algoriphagus sp.]|uniref:hypothetical protein n=1 Tax=uncultured Algoriphagus sp. TaxID=417365 RepID=UPI0030EF3B2B|tara:strand:- start:89112 stop:89522 length:411 start_codon:yes stop_codon:yes gene_type:complete
MKRTIPFLILTLFLLTNACGPADNVKLRQEVIAVHDEVMPKMAQLKSLERKALKKAEELESGDTTDSVKVEQYKALGYDLAHGYDSMFDWMHQYDIEDGDRTEEELKTYLDSQMVLVKDVNEEIKKALEKADKLLE